MTVGSNCTDPLTCGHTGCCRAPGCQCALLWLLALFTAAQQWTLVSGVRPGIRVYTAGWSNCKWVKWCGPVTGDRTNPEPQAAAKTLAISLLSRGCMFSPRAWQWRPVTGLGMKASRRTVGGAFCRRSQWCRPMRRDRARFRTTSSCGALAISMDFHSRKSLPGVCTWHLRPVMNIRPTACKCTAGEASFHLQGSA